MNELIVAPAGANDAAAQFLQCKRVSAAGRACPVPSRESPTPIHGSGSYCTVRALPDATPARNSPHFLAWLLFMMA
jgi:hypothetical protein